MTFEELRDFLQSKMKLSHIYQPLLIRSLVEAGGSATVRQMATAFLSQDESQIQYYEKRLKEMPVRVLSRHGVIAKDGDLIRLEVPKLTFKQKAEVKKICEEKLQEYIANRGLGIWEHRFLDTDPVPGSLWYRVLSDAGGRCALCGATKKETSLHADHIKPRSKGGKTEYDNLQVLCAKCNLSKGNKDQTDFRHDLPADYRADCFFCQRLSQGDKIILQNALSFAVLDNFPVSEGHTLVLPKRHIADYFDMSENEQNAINELIAIRRKQLLEDDSSIGGFNVGVNCGEAAGQTVFHCHVHLIPRRLGDTPNPRGGVRGVIPSKMSY